MSADGRRMATVALLSLLLAVGVVAAAWAESVE